MNDFTPTTEEVRGHYIFSRCDDPVLRDDIAAEFNRWLVAHDQGIRDTVKPPVIAAGWRPPARTIETVEELEAVADGTVIRDSDGDFFEAIYDGDCIMNFWLGDEPLGSGAVSLPATVLWEPGDDDE